MKLRVIHTSDIHGYLYPTNYVEQKNIGLLSLYKQFNKDENTLIIDGGDFIQGSALSYYIVEEEPKYKSVYYELLNSCGYDCVSIGNHEFNFGTQFLTDVYSKVDVDVLCANVSGLSFTKPYKIFTKGDKKIGVIGLLTQVIPMFEQPSHIEGITFNDILKTYEKYETELKEQCDYIIVNYHGGAELDIDDLTTPTEELVNENLGISLFNKFESIDLLLMGHQHRIFCRNHSNRIITQSGHQAQGFIELNIDLDTKELISNDYVYNKGNIGELSSITDELSDRVTQYLDTILSHASHDLKIVDHFSARLHGHPLVNFIHDVQLSETNAEISATNIFDSSVGFGKDITMRQVIANYPFANTLVVLKVSRTDILEALEISAGYFEIENNMYVESEKFTVPKRQDYQYDMFKGFNYTLDISKPVGSRVVSHDLEDRMYTICLNNYRASNYSWYPVYENKEVIKRYDRNMIDVIVDYLKEHQEIKIDNNINFKIKGV